MGPSQYRQARDSTDDKRRGAIRHHEPSQRQKGPARGHLFPRVFNHPRLKQSCSSWPGFPGRVSRPGTFLPHTSLRHFLFLRPALVIGITNMSILFTASPRALGTMLMSGPSQVASAWECCGRKGLLSLGKMDDRLLLEPLKIHSFGIVVFASSPRVV
ncbi:hypothetical protein B0I37DRAFT_228741 [Chaetomium sp. MPI-CAGE-AT-0009]|nr:hypothetical protein B0I37DRAFT_228741 [Chaetomium sp. MPI-CAGE-AT-0009]